MEKDTELLPLSPVDYIFTGPGSYAISFALAYDEVLDPAQIKGSLEEALHSFWPLRSKLVKVSGQSYAFQPTHDGLQFQISSSPHVFDESKDIDMYVSPVVSLQGEPLTRIQLTETPEGSVLGVSISHALVDGFSFVHFLSSWARIAQGKRILAPSLSRKVLMANKIDHENSVDAEDLLSHCGLFLGTQRRNTHTGSAGEETRALSADAIRDLRRQAERDCKVSLFDNDVVTAYVWKEYGPRWSQLGNDSATFVTIPYDFRRLLREVPRMYFGCALAFATISLSYERLIGASLGEIACLVRNGIARVSPDYVHGSLSTLESLRITRGLSALEQIEVRHPQQGLVVTNITRLPSSDIDFGWGPPIGFKATAQGNRGVVLLPSEDGVRIRAFPPPNNKSVEEESAAI